MLAAQLAELPGDALALVLAQLPSAREVDRAASVGRAFRAAAPHNSLLGGRSTRSQMYAELETVYAFAPMMRALVNTNAAKILSYVTGSDLGARHGRPSLHASPFDTVGIEIGQNASAAGIARLPMIESPSSQRAGDYNMPTTMPLLFTLGYDYGGAGASAAPNAARTGDANAARPS